MTFEPTTATNTIAGQWMEPNDTNVHSFTVPSEPAAGVVEILLDPGPQVGARLAARMGGEAGTVAADGGLDRGTTAKLVFEVGPGQEVTLDVESSRNAPAEEYPIAYLITWTYSGRADCYEPNDTMDVAKSILTDTDVEAYLLFKRTGNTHISTAHDDWYRFNLSQASPVTARLSSVPADVSASVHVYDVEGNSVRAGNAGGFGRTVKVEIDRLAPGDYFVRVRAGNFASGQAFASGLDDPTPDHFDSPYTLRIETQPQDGPDDHDCVVYDPMMVTNTIMGEWTEPNDANEHSFSVPVEPAAGVVEVRLIPDPLVGPQLTASMGDDGGVIASDGGLDAGTTARVVFEGGPGGVVDLEAISSKNAPAEEYPLAYEIIWTYSGRADCYEPNDIMLQARAVPMNQQLEAYFLFKRTENRHVLPDHDDWYRFSLDDEATVSVHLLTLPTDARASLHVFDADGNSVRGVPSQEFGVPVDLDAGRLSPGDYFLRVRAGSFNEGAVAAGIDDPVPPHFDERYTFEIEAR